MPSFIGPKNARSGLSIYLWLFVLISLAIAAWGWWFLAGTRKIGASGGLYFFNRIELPVARFAQADARWGGELLGPTPATLAAEGCAVAAAAMVLASYGQDIDPGRLNAFLTEHGGYTDRGWLYWEKAAEFDPGKAEHLYEDLASYWLIDRNLLQGNPVIVRVRYPNGITHFVVICGKQGFDYLIQDPGSNGAQGVYPLKNLTHEIEALRFYRKK
jgi:Peptidase_C39 like family